MFLSIPWVAPRWLYMVMLFLLQLTQLSSQLSTITIVKNIYNQKFPNQLYIQPKSHSVCYIQSCYIPDSLAVDTCRRRVPNESYTQHKPDKLPQGIYQVITVHIAMFRISIAKVSVQSIYYFRRYSSFTELVA